MTDKKVGRPSKKELAATKELSKREQSAALREFRSRLLLNPKSEKLIEKLFSTAFDDESKQQGLAMKILADRLIPVAGFTHEGKQQNQVQISITGIGTGAEPSPGVTISGSSGEVEDED
jgi:hypothetical protein